MRFGIVEQFRCIQDLLGRMRMYFLLNTIERTALLFRERFEAFREVWVLSSLALYVCAFVFSRREPGGIHLRFRRSRSGISFRNIGDAYLQNREIDVPH
jgi:hypothetical protein